MFCKLKVIHLPDFIAVGRLLKAIARLGVVFLNTLKSFAVALSHIAVLKMLALSAGLIAHLQSL